MKALLLSFGYPGYPEDVMLERIVDGKRFLTELGIDYISTRNIIELQDCDSALEVINSNDFDYIIIMVATWIEVTNVLTLVSLVKHKPMLLWCHENIYRTGMKEVLSLGAIASAGVLRQAFEEFEYKYKFVVGNPFDKKISKEIIAFDRAAHAIGKLQRSRVGLVGYTSLGMYTGMADHIKVKKFFGSEVFHVDQYSVLNNLEDISIQRIENVKKSLCDDWDISNDVDEDLLNKTAAIYTRLKDIIMINRLDCITVKCQYEMSVEYNFSPCVSLSLLGEEYPVSCEGDIHQVITQMILSQLSGNITTYGDVLEFLEDGIICAACGFAPRYFLKPDKPNISKHTAIISGLLITSPFKEGKVTLSRLANTKDGYKMHLIKGRIEELNNFHEVGCPQYAGSVIRFENKTIDQFKQEIMSQHYAIVFGDWEDEIKDFCKLMDIKII